MMSGFLQKVQIYQEQVLNETLSDEMVDNWPMMESAIPVFFILGIYLWFCLYQGPKWMENRKPFNLRYILIAYNAFQVIFSAFLASRLFAKEGTVSYMWNHSCIPLPRDTNPYKDLFYSGTWWYFISKVVDLLDTVFFVLRKKQNQVTVLHVYHHTNMVFSVWGFLKYIKGEQGVIAGVLNSIVHIIMYSYYLLSAFGPQIQKYLWWKKYITKLQLAQFLIIICHLSLLLVFNCNMPKGLTLYMYVQCLIFIALFSNFYFQAYIKNDKKTSSIGQDVIKTCSQEAMSNGEASNSEIKKVK